MQLIKPLIDKTVGTLRGVVGKVTGIVIPHWIKIGLLVLIAAIVLAVVL